MICSYFTIDPAATANYINFYRGMCDSEEMEVEP